MVCRYFVGEKTGDGFRSSVSGTKKISFDFQRLYKIWFMNNWEKFTFQQNKDHKTILNYVKIISNSKRKNTLGIMTWPPQSSGFSTIELTQDQSYRRVQREYPMIVNELFSSVL